MIAAVYNPSKNHVVQCFIPDSHTLCICLKQLATYTMYVVDYMLALSKQHNRQACTVGTGNYIGSWLQVKNTSYMQAVMEQVQQIRQFRHIEACRLIEKYHAACIYIRIAKGDLHGYIRDTIYGQAKLIIRLLRTYIGRHRTLQVAMCSFPYRALGVGHCSYRQVEENYRYVGPQDTQLRKQPCIAGLQGATMHNILLQPTSYKHFS